MGERRHPAVWRLAAVATAACLLVATAACSDDGDETGTSTAEAPDGLIPAGEGVHGVTDTTIEVGMFVLDARAVNEAVAGLGGEAGADEESDGEAAIRTVVDHINANGGIAGRQVVPVIHEIDPKSFLASSTADQQAQATCADWSEDHKVFAMTTLPRGKGMWDCAAATDTVVVHVGSDGSGSPQWMGEDAFEGLHDLWYAPGYLTAERRDAALVEHLADQGFFEDDARVGILVEDRPAVRASVESTLLPALEEQGVDDPVEIVYADPIEADWANHILKLQSESVTHVVMSASEGMGFGAAAALRAAEDQEYRPRWGVGSDQGPGAMLQLGAPVAQLANVQGIGWAPITDVADTTPQSATAELCDQLNDDAGLPALSNRPYCSFLLFLQFVLDRADEISPKGMSEALDEVGDTWVDANTHDGVTSLGPDRHDGATLVRDLSYSDACGEQGAQCFEYTGPPTEL